MSKQPFFARGTYQMKVTDQGFAETDSGTPYFYLIGTLQAELINGEPAACKNYERQITLYLSEKAAPHTIARLRGLGWEGGKLAELDPHDPHSLSWVGQLITCECEHENSKKNPGDVYERWQLPAPAGGGRKAPTSSKELASKLDAIYGDHVKATATKKAPVVKRAPPKEIAEADIPF